MEKITTAVAEGTSALIEPIGIQPGGHAAATRQDFSTIGACGERRDRGCLLDFSVLILLIHAHSQKEKDVDVYYLFSCLVSRVGLAESRLFLRDRD